MDRLSLGPHLQKTQIFSMDDMDIEFESFETTSSYTQYDSHPNLYIPVDPNKLAPKTYILIDGLNLFRHVLSIITSKAHLAGYMDDIEFKQTVVSFRGEDDVIHVFNEVKKFTDTFLTNPCIIFVFKPIQKDIWEIFKKEFWKTFNEKGKYELYVVYPDPGDKECDDRLLLILFLQLKEENINNSDHQQ